MTRAFGRATLGDAMEQSANSPIPVVLVDPRAIWREVLGTMLGHERAIRLVGVTADVLEARALVEEGEAAVVLVDWDVAGGVRNAVAAFRSCDPRPRVVAFGIDGGPAFLEAALRAGAHDYLTKEDPPRRWVTAVQSPASTGSSAIAAAAERIARGGRSAHRAD